ncbi:MAG: hypothetical protein Q7J28_15925 [Caulobacter sp.]|nr:hypothetical protein [Caulobacter sp.]
MKLPVSVQTLASLSDEKLLHAALDLERRRKDLKSEARDLSRSLKRQEERLRREGGMLVGGIAVMALGFIAGPVAGILGWIAAAGAFGLLIPGTMQSASSIADIRADAQRLNQIAVELNLVADAMGLVAAERRRR